MYQIYGIKNCDTMKKALNWLNENNVDYVFHNYKTDGLTSSQLNHLMARLDWTVLLNTKGLTYRKLDKEVKAQLIYQSEAEKVILSNPSIVKRPILVKGDRAFIGFSIEGYGQFISETLNE